MEMQSISIENFEISKALKHLEDSAGQIESEKRSSSDLPRDLEFPRVKLLTVNLLTVEPFTNSFILIETNILWSLCRFIPVNDFLSRIRSLYSVLCSVLFE